MRAGPTKEMHKITRDINKVVNLIQNRLKTDCQRAESYSSCADLIIKKTHRGISTSLKRTKSVVDHGEVSTH